MAVPATTADFLDLCTRSGVLEQQTLTDFVARSPLPEEPRDAAMKLVKGGLLTPFQAKLLLAGKHKGFTFGQLKVMDFLGHGGMGSVYLCEQIAMKRLVAVKVLPEKQAKDVVARERFYREARAVAALDHPNIVRAHDINCIGDLHFLVMEYVEGEDLESIVKRRGALPIHEAINYIIQAAKGLQHAHERGLVHRDIKPANLLRDKAGKIKILDMGLARFFNEKNDNLTNRLDKGAVLGTIDYLAPEQAIQSSEVDIRADIYSLGATLYTVLVGSPPFTGTTTQKLVHIQMRTPEPLHKIRPDIPKKLSAVIARMMAKDPKQRFQTPEELIVTLSEWVQAAPTTTGQKSKVRPPINNAPIKSRKNMWIAMVIGAIVLLGGMGWYLVSEASTK